MLEAALFSVNKRAKNWRDKKREYKRYRHANYDYAGEAEAQENRMYKKKDLLLSAVKPVCIHQESWGCERQRIYNFGTEYSDAELSAIYKGLIVHTGSFVSHSHSRSRYDDYDGYDGYDEYDDYDPYGYVTTFADVEDPENERTRSYLFYVVGEHSFHTPIDNDKVANYPDLPVYFIGKLETSGKEIGDLASVQFVDKVIALIQSGSFSYVPRNRTAEEQAAVTALASAGAIDRKQYISASRKEWISDDIDAFGDTIIECMRRSIANDLPYLRELNGEEKETIQKKIRKIVQEGILEPCKQIPEDMSLADPNVLHGICIKMSATKQRLLYEKIPKPYEDRATIANILRDSENRFGGSDVTAKELVSAYPDREYIEKASVYRFRHETAEKLVNEAWESCKESYDAANNFWRAKKRGEKREKKGKKKKGRR